MGDQNVSITKITTFHIEKNNKLELSRYSLGMIGLRKRTGFESWDGDEDEYDDDDDEKWTGLELSAFWSGGASGAADDLVLSHI